MSYQVLARKWRPQRFEDVLGQQAVTRTLRNALKSKRIAQAFVFAGPRGCGKTTSARILARALNCVNGPTPDPCGVCEPCVEIAEGRDMGTVVFPKARCKIFLDASIGERALRRALELEAKGHTVDRAALEAEIAARDDNDRNRAVAPLRAAPDATIVDTTGKSLDKVIDEIVALARAPR